MGRLPFTALQDALFELIDTELAHEHSDELTPPPPPQPKQQRLQQQQRAVSTEPQFAGPPPPLERGPVVNLPLQAYADTLRIVLNDLITVSEIGDEGDGGGGGQNRGAAGDGMERSPLGRSPRSESGWTSNSRGASPPPSPSRPPVNSHGGRHSPVAFVELRLRHRWPRWQRFVGECMRKRNLLRSATRARGNGAGQAFRALHRSISDDDVGIATRGLGGKSLELSYAQLMDAWKDDGRYDDLTFPYHVVARPIGQIGRPSGEARKRGQRQDVEEMLCFMRLLDGADEGSVTLDNFRDAMASSAESLWDWLRETSERRAKRTTPPGPGGGEIDGRP
jgi:hypothetical protein